jgi:hypothetical protein
MRERVTADIHEMVTEGLIDPRRLPEFFSKIADQLYKYPAIDPPSFRRALEKIAAESSGT